MIKKEINDRIVRLLLLELLGEINQEERRELDLWFNRNERNRQFFQQIREESFLDKEHAFYEKTDTEKAIFDFKRKIVLPVKKRHTLISVWWKYAAVLLLPLLVAAIFLWQNRQSELPLLAQQVESITPGSMQAILILDNGEQISLTSGGEKEIQFSKDVKVSQRHDSLVYTSCQTTRKEVHYNELQIPRGGEYKVTLADGTQVYLNSATRMKYPIAFDSKERKVYLDGEAYFEVTKESDRPFLVEVNGIEIKVYGTSFNINSYKEAQVQTVLVEGSVGVRILSSGNEKRLKPGEMAVFDELQESIDVKKVNTDLYTGWRKGVLRFENERLEDILTTLSNWYNVDVFYQTQDVKDFHFTGYLGRYKEINTILSSITLATGVQFNIQGRTIVVSK